MLSDAARIRRRARVVGCVLAVLFSSGLPAHADSSVCARRTFEAQSFTVCKAVPSKHDIRLYLRRPGGELYSRPDAVPATNLLFSINAGMFTPEHQPAGLYIESGKAATRLNTRMGPGNFHLMPNGVFWMKDGRAAVSTTADFAKSAVSPDLATQSGPMLVIGGNLHPKFDDNGPSRTIRNGVGVSTSGEVYFAISEDAVSFGVFARLFRDGLHCPDALYLDGAVSQLYVPGENRFNTGVPLGPLFAVYTTKRK